MARIKRDYPDNFWGNPDVIQAFWLLPETIRKDILERLDKPIRTALMATR